LAKEGCREAAGWFVQCYNPPVPAAARFNWTVALTLFGILLLGNSDTQLVSPLLPLVAEDLRTTPGRTGIIVSSYSVAAAIFALLIGPLSDRVGRKKVLAAGLVLFSGASLLTSSTQDFSILVMVRMLTGFAAGALSTCALSYAADFYPYAERGRAMGLLSMAYSFAFVIGVPAGAVLAARAGWRSVFLALAVLGLALAMIVSLLLPTDHGHPGSRGSLRNAAMHLARRDTLAGIAAAFLTSGGIVGFLTYLGAWLRTSYGVGVDQIGTLFIASGIAATAAAPVSGWLSDRLGKKPLIVVSNVVLAGTFVGVAGIGWGVALFAAIAVLSMAASARQGPLHALTTELVPRESRGEYVAIRNAASQLGIASVAAISSTAFDAWGFIAVAWIAAVATILVPVTCLWMKEPGALGFRL